MKQLVALLGLLSFTVACGSSGARAASPEGGGGGGDPERGKELYAKECGACHGSSGQGTKLGPPVVGEGALPLDPPEGKQRDVQFRTALDVFQWSKAHMPPGKVGAISDEDMLSIMAFALTANGVDLGGKPLDGASAAKIVLHP